VVDQALEARHQPHPDDELAPVALVARVLQQRHRERQALDVGRRERRREPRAAARAPQLLLRLRRLRVDDARAQVGEHEERALPRLGAVAEDRRE